MITQETKIPARSLLKREEESFDYIDSFQDLFSEKGQATSLTKVLQLFVSGGPKWADSLLNLRNKIVKPFGLKTSDSITDEQSDSINYEIGNRVGIFLLLDKTENEVILGDDDKHLNFKVSLLLAPIVNKIDKKKLSLTTVVKFHNLFGRLYFLAIMPFHKLIVRSSLKSIIKQLESEKE